MLPPLPVRCCRPAATEGLACVDVPVPLVAVPPLLLLLPLPVLLAARLLFAIA